MTAVKKKASKAKATKTKKVSPKLVKTEKKVKAVKEPKVKKVKEPKIDTSREEIETPNFNTDSQENEKSGDYIKRMLSYDSHTTDEIVALVQENFKGSKVSNSDVSFHRWHLKKAGNPAKLVRLDKDGNRYARVTE